MSKGLERIEVKSGGGPSRVIPSADYSFEELLRKNPQIAHRLRADTVRKRVKVALRFRPNQNAEYWGGTTFPFNIFMTSPLRLQVGGHLLVNPGDGSPVTALIHDHELEAARTLVERDADAIRMAEERFIREVKRWAYESRAPEGVINGRRIRFEDLSDDPRTWPESLREKACTAPMSPHGFFRQHKHRDPRPLASLEVVETGVQPPKDAYTAKLEQIAGVVQTEQGPSAAEVAGELIDKLIESGAIHVKRPPGRPPKRKDGEEE